MRRRSTSITQPISPAEPKSRTINTGSKTFRVKSGSDQTEEVTADKMIVENDGLTFKDASGNVVAVFRGYGLSAVCDENCTAQQCDPCESVRASDFF